MKKIFALTAVVLLSACGHQSYELSTHTIVTGGGVDENGHGYTDTAEVNGYTTTHGGTKITTYGNSVDAGGIIFSQGFDVNCNIFGYCGDN